jgi:thioredoxin-dependent peroxiredoxin
MMAVKKTAKKKAAPKKAAAKKTASAKKPAKKATAKASPDTDAEPFVAHRTHLKPGDKAPAFEGMDQNGNSISLAALKGKKVILYFYPKDDTPACTAEACSLRDEHRYLAKENYVVIGVSPDNEKRHKKFADKYSLPFSLLPDEDHRIMDAYDVWGTKKFMGRIYDGVLRTTFIIDEKGIIERVITEVKTKEHGSQVREKEF